jgi:hypothetical protein
MKSAEAVIMDIIIIPQFPRLKMHLLRSSYPNLLEMGKSGKGETLAAEVRIMASL